jgi:hypothetical protein
VHGLGLFLLVGVGVGARVGLWMKSKEYGYVLCRCGFQVRSGGGVGIVDVG